MRWATFALLLITLLGIAPNQGHGFAPTTSAVAIAAVNHCSDDGCCSGGAHPICVTCCAVCFGAFAEINGEAGLSLELSAKHTQPIVSTRLSGRSVAPGGEPPKAFSRA